MHQSFSWATVAGCGGLLALLACRGRGCEFARVEKMATADATK